MNLEKIVKQITHIWEKNFNKNGIKPQDKFSILGGKSEQADAIYQDIKKLYPLNQKIRPTIVYDYPTIMDLAEHLFYLENADNKHEYVINKQVLSGDIAVVGMACRFPGGANTPELFWENLQAGKNSISEIPNSRWDVDAYFDENQDVPGKMYTKKGGFLDIDLSAFDADFFGISPKETQEMDPQQRLLLELTWEALERSGINPESLNKTLGAVFIGIGTHDYEMLEIQSSQSNENINAYVGIGNSASAAAGRIAYFLGMQGETLAVDTACSSSLVAIHLACEALLNQEADIAIVGGVNLMLTPQRSIRMSKAHMLSPDGLCKTFDASANGYVRGEGAGVVILKRLPSAVANRDPILAIIKGSAVNHGGASSGLTVPNGRAQEQLLLSTLQDVNFNPDDIDYIETHGTGTRIGDPIEVGAIEAVFSGRSKSIAPLVLGAVKANIGHLEAAAGMASFIKTVLCLQHEAIPKQLNFKQLNPRINLSAIPAQIPLELSAWNRAERTRRAGVSSFGFSGTNAHIILEEAPVKTSLASIVLPEYLFCFSAKTAYSLEQQLDLFQSYLAQTRETLADVSFTLNTGRQAFEYRLAVIATDKDSLLEKLKHKEFMTQGTAIDKTAITPVYEIAKAYVNGESLDWSGLYRPYLESLRKVQLPTYPFERQHYWLEKGLSSRVRDINTSHPLWQSKEQLSNGICSRV